MITKNEKAKTKKGLATVVRALILLILLASGLRAEGIQGGKLVPNDPGFFFDTSISPGGAYHDAEAVDFGSCAFVACIENRSATLNVLVDLVPCGTSVVASDLTTPVDDGDPAGAGDAYPVHIVYPVSATSPVPCFWGWYAGLIWQGQTSAATAVGRILR